MENPIKYSDLIVADDSITKLIQQLKDLLTTYNGTAEDIKRQATELAAKLREVNGATEQGRQSIKGGATDAEKLARAYEKNAFAQSETAKELARVNEETRQLNNINKLAAKGLITKQRSNEDARDLEIALTPQGEQLKERAKSIPAQVCACLTGCPQIPELREALLQMMKILKNNKTERSF